MPRGLASLASLALRPPSPAPAALGPARDWAALAAARDAWRDAFAALAADRVALYFSDTFDFAAALLGAWAAGKTAVLPGDATPGTCQLLRPFADAFAGEFPAELGPLAAPGPAKTAAPSPPPAIAVMVFTSGSTGQPAAIPKGLEELDAELRTQEAAFGGLLGDCAVYATVSHQHIYGLLFKCLWPLASGRPFLGRSLPFPEQLRSESAAVERLALVATPAHLKRLPDTVDWSPLRARLAALFSSGGPLSWEAAQDCAAKLGLSPIEVYGSSETGGIAWRRREREDGPWTPLEGVELAVDGASGALRVRSPFIHGGGWHQTADKADFNGGRFQLLGRIDKIAKIEEKRVSLSAMEARLALHPAVAEARVLALQGERTVLGAVVRLSAGGAGLLAAQGKRAVNEALRTHLAMDFERVTLPKRWRYVDALPLGPGGKTRLADLEALFHDSAEAPRLPELLGEEAQGPRKRLLRCRIPDDLHYFKGHFPSAPLLAGVVQVDWAVHFGRARFPLQGAFKRIEALKFQRILQPGAEFELSLEHAPEKGMLSFRYQTAAHGHHSSGRIEFS